MWQEEILEAPYQDWTNFSTELLENFPFQFNLKIIYVVNKTKEVSHVKKSKKKFVNTVILSQSIHQSELTISLIMIL